MIENTVVSEEYLKQAAAALFKKRILATLSSYQDAIRAANKALTEARGQDIRDITVLLEVNYPTFKACWYATKSRVNQMTNKWWFFQSRLQARLNEILMQYAHPLVVAQVIENATLRQRLDEAEKKIAVLQSSNQALERQSRLSNLPSSKSVPIPAPVPRGYSSHSSVEDSDDGSDVELGRVGARPQSCPDYRRSVSQSAAMGNSPGRMFASSK